MSDRNKLPTSLPIFLGATAAEVHKQLGEPDRTFAMYGCNCENYLNTGICIKYTEHGCISEIDGAWYKVDGKPGKFTGDILGVRLGDTAESCLQNLGPPHGKKEYSWSKFWTWKVADFYFQIELWTESGNEDLWGEYREGCVKRIVAVDHLDEGEEIEDKAALLIQDMYPEIALDQIKRTLKET